MQQRYVIGDLEDQDFFSAGAGAFGGVAVLLYFIFFFPFSQLPTSFPWASLSLATTSSV